MPKAAKPSACAFADALAADNRRGTVGLLHRQVGAVFDGRSDVGERDARRGADARRVRGFRAVGTIDAVPGVRSRRSHQGSPSSPTCSRARAWPWRRPDSPAPRCPRCSRSTDDRNALGRRQVDRDAALALHHLEPSRLGERQDHPDPVAGERLDLDHPRPQVGEHRRAVRRGEQRRQLQHRHPRKGEIVGVDRRCGAGAPAMPPARRSDRGARRASVRSS